MKKSQSAMEYLMTYGWAILIIAVVLGIMFQLGLFGGGAFTTKRPPNSCEIVRPNGPGTSSYANLEGECNGILPEYVAFVSNALGGNIRIVTSGTFSFPNGFSVALWFRSVGGGSCGVSEVGTLFSATQLPTGSNPQFGVGTTSPALMYSTTWNGLGNSGPSVAGTPIDGKWHFVALTYNNVASTLYFDGSNSVASTPSYAFTTINEIEIGYGTGQNWCSANASVANLQLYNTSLTGAEAQALWLEGVGGAPVYPTYAYLWWTLNGNANDHSGNDYNGQANSGVSYSSTWTSQYTAP